MIPLPFTFLKREKYIVGVIPPHIVGPVHFQKFLNCPRGVSFQIIPLEVFSFLAYSNTAYHSHLFIYRYQPCKTICSI